MNSLFRHQTDKCHIKDWIVDLFPDNYKELTYLEPYCGTANVLLHKEESKDEILNDPDNEITMILKAIRDQTDQFIKQIKKIKNAKQAFEKAQKTKEFSDEISRAVNEFILRRMSKGGSKESFINPSTFNVKSLEAAADRLKNVYIFEESPIKVIQIFNDKETLIYANPPMLPESTEDEKYEAILNNHIQLADVLKNFKGKVLLSGQPSRLYNKLYKGWRYEKKQLDGKEKIELLWCNF